MMTVNSRPTPRSRFLALTRLVSRAALFLALPAAVWGQVDERDEAQRILYVGIKAGEGYVPWEGSDWFRDEDTETPLGLDGLWLVTGERRWGIGVAATYARMGFAGTLRGVPWLGTDVEVGGASRVDLDAGALGAALVLGRSGRRWTVYGGAGFGQVGTDLSVSPEGLPDDVKFASGDYERLISGIAAHVARDRDPRGFSNAFILAHEESLRSADWLRRFKSIPDPNLPDSSGLYVVLGVLRGKPRGFNYGLKIDSFSATRSRFFSVNMTLGWKF